MKILHNFTVQEPRFSQLCPQSQTPSLPLEQRRRGTADGIRALFQTIRHRATKERRGSKDLSVFTDEDGYVVQLPTFNKHERSYGRALMKTIGHKTASMFKRQKIPSFEILYRNGDGDISTVNMRYDHIQYIYSLPLCNIKYLCLQTARKLRRPTVLERPIFVKAPTHSHICLCTIIQMLL